MDDVREAMRDHDEREEEAAEDSRPDDEPGEEQTPAPP
jgi:hypothetical protein